MSFFIVFEINYAIAANVILAGLISIITAPYGIYNKFTNGTYVIDSSGLGGYFITGHNDDFYNYIVNSPSQGTAYYKKIKKYGF